MRACRLETSGSCLRLKWLTYYAERFPTVEVNNTFYRLPERETFAEWGRGSRPGFIIAVKASRFITHLKRLRDPVEPVARLWDRAAGLGAKLGPVLFQTPPRFPVDTKRLEVLLRELPTAMRAAFEFRDSSWHTAEVYRLLDRYGAAFVLADTPGASFAPGPIGSLHCRLGTRGSTSTTTPAEQRSATHGGCEICYAIGGFQSRMTTPLSPAR